MLENLGMRAWEWEAVNWLSSGIATPGPTRACVRANIIQNGRGNHRRDQSRTNVSAILQEKSHLPLLLKLLRQGNQKEHYFTVLF